MTSLLTWLSEKSRILAITSVSSTSVITLSSLSNLWMNLHPHINFLINITERLQQYIFNWKYLHIQSVFLLFFVALRISWMPKLSAEFHTDYHIIFCYICPDKRKMACFASCLCFEISLTSDALKMSQTETEWTSTGITLIFEYWNEESKTRRPNMRKI